MKSTVVVVSWYSSCLGLRCIHELHRLLPARDIYVIQTGKTADQRRQFRRLLPSGVRSIPYPAVSDGQHGAVLDYTIRKALPDAEGVWFVDHDIYNIEKSLPRWIESMERRVKRSRVCLSVPRPRNMNEPLTIPFFWISPRRLPQQTPSLVSVPSFRDSVSHKRLHNRPWAKGSFDSSGQFGQPEKDTLWAALEYLKKRKLTATFQRRKRWWLPHHMNIPRHSHFGGIWALGGLYEIDRKKAPEELRLFVRAKAAQFLHFFNECPQEWQASENPVLLDRARQITVGGWQNTN